MDTQVRNVAESPDRPIGVPRSVTWAVFLGAASAVLYACLSILRPFAGVIAWSVVLAIICYPIHEWLVRKTGRVAVSAFLSSVLAALAFVIPLLLIGAVALKEGAALAHSFANAVQAEPQPMTLAAPALAWIKDRFGMGLDQAAFAAWIHEHISEWASIVGHYSVSIAGGLFDAVVSSVFVVFAMFLLLRDGQALVGAIPELLPFGRDRSAALLRRIKDAIQASVYGVVVIALIQGALCGAMFWLVGIPAAALWGMVTVFASVLPVVGASAVWVPGALYLAMSGHWSRAIVLAIWGAFVVSGIDNILRPRLVAGRVGLSEVAMFFALLGGFSVFGALGVILGPAAFATATALVDILREPQPVETSVVGDTQRSM